MTDPVNLAALASEIETLRASLATVKASIDLIGKPAIKKASEIHKALDEVIALYDNIITSAANEARAARLMFISDVSIDFDTDRDNLLTTRFFISYNRQEYDSRYNASIPRHHKCVGFGNLPDDVYEYILTLLPSIIPAPIMALAPGDPEAAFDIYFAGIRRGFFRTKAAA